MYWRLNQLISLSVFLVLIVSCDKIENKNAITYIPDYYFDSNYLGERICAINKTINQFSDSCETFFWITDMHWESNLNARCSPSLIKYLSINTGISKILNGGDNGDSYEVSSNAIDTLRFSIDSDEVYCVNGNHEMYEASMYENSYERVSNMLRGHCNDIVYGDINKSYFYHDNIKTKTRYIGLSTFGLFFNNNYESAYNSEQLNWLESKALNVEHGWTIIIYTHCLYNINCNTDELILGPVGSTGFIKAIDNYSGNGTIACVLMGHSHRDRLHIGPTGVPYIISAGDRYVPYESDINVPRILGTHSEQRFEAVIIDKIGRCIYLYTIGANARDGYDNNPGYEVNLRIVTY